MITPQTSIELIKGVLTEDQENQLTFTSVSAQTAYFEGLSRLPLNNCTYQRKDNSIRFEGNIESLWNYNYVRYKNAQFGDKWFYAFITDMRYVNEEVTEIQIKTDVWQTWMFDITLEPSFIEREHVDNDGFGLHTIPEGIEYGQYIVNSFTQMQWAHPSDSGICMQVSDFPSDANITGAPIQIYNGMPSGCYYIFFNKNTAQNVSTWINAYVKDEKADAIMAIFPVPRILAQPDDPDIPTQIGDLQNSLTGDTYIFLNSQSPVKMTSYIIPPSLGNSFEGYFPKNNKLYVSPYCYFYLNTFGGTTVEYNYEQFNGPILFDIYGNITSGCEFRADPQNIIGAANGSYGYGISLSGMPQGSWNSNTFLNWWALNSANISIESEVDAITSGLNAVGQLTSLNIAGAASTGVEYWGRVQQRMNQVRVASKLPNQARGDTANRSLNWGNGYGAGGFYRMCIKREYAEIIDKYFTMFGYKVNVLKTPNIYSRQYFNYIKTVGLNLMGSLPQNDIIELKAIFDRGCTFWHNPNYFLNYDVNNAII